MARGPRQDQHGVIGGERSFTLTPDDGGTRLAPGETFRGLLVPFSGKTLAAAESGDQALNNALKAYSKPGDHRAASPGYPASRSMRRAGRSRRTEVQSVGWASARGEPGQSSVTKATVIDGCMFQNFKRRTAMSENETENDTPVSDTLLVMTATSLENSDLSPRELMIARTAALVAVDAPPASYALNAVPAADSGITLDDVEDILVAVAPIVGTARVVSATANIAEGLGFVIALAEAELEEELEEEEEEEEEEEPRRRSKDLA